MKTPVSTSIILLPSPDPAFRDHCIRSVLLNTPAEGCEIVCMVPADGEDPLLTATRGRIIRTGVHDDPWHAGCEAALGEYLVLINPEIETQPGWLDALLRIAFTRPNSAVCPKVVGPGSRIAEAGGSELRDGSFVGRGNGARRYLPVWNHVAEVEAGSRFCLLVRNKDLLSAGPIPAGSDPATALLAASLSLRAMGRNIIYQPHSVVSLQQKNLSPARPVSFEQHPEPADKEPLVSVIIPTFNRASYLRRSLESLTEQSVDRGRFEVIVVNDGSSDGTEAVCAEFQHRLRIRYVHQPNGGISVAKNTGIQTARGGILLFFDDDDVAGPGLVAEHLRSHKEHPEEHMAVLGWTGWHPSLTVTEVMRYVTDIGRYLFSYPDLKDGQILDYTWFWGGRSSCKRSFLLKHGLFNPLFRFGSEDIELGYRLSRRGLTVVFNRKAESFMVRPVTYEEFCRRCEKQGRSQFHFSLLHPDPAVQKWCGVEFAAERFKAAEDMLEQAGLKVREMESMLNSLDRADSHQLQDTPEERENVREQLREALHGLYWTSFDLSKLKGIAAESAEWEQLQESTGRTGSDAPAAVPAALIERFFGLPPLPEKKRILVLDIFLPVYDRASGALRAFHILKALLALGYDVTFLSRYPDYADQYRAELEELGIETIAGDAAAVRATGSPALAPAVDLKTLLAERRFSAAIIAFWDNAEYYLPRLRRYAPALPVIVDSVDIVFLRKIREAELRKNDEQLKQALAGKEREISVYCQADRLWVVTEKDREVIEPHVGNIPIDIIPNVHAHVDAARTFDDTEGLLFVGNFWHQPNVDAVEYFLRDVFPLILAQMPDVTIRIVGDHLPDRLRSLQSDRVRFLGYVPDLAPLLLQARVSVAPLRYGAGMKGKVGEALSWGLPVVTTSIGAEGMGLVHGKNVLLADRARDFAAQVVRVYRDPALWQSLSDNGRSLVHERWSPEAILSRLQPALAGAGVRPQTVSIIILTFNQLAYTRECVASIRKHTPEPHEIIFIDNGSTDGTLPWLRALVRENPIYRLIANKKNLGFAKGCNQGMAAAAGEYLLLLNNDVVVTEHWLAGLLEHVRRGPETGVVGPMTNNISGPQKVPQPGYSSIEGLDAYARSFREKNRHRRIESRRIVGFCMLFGKRLARDIGLFDESFGTGNFEDDDYCLRAALTGYRNVIAGDVFIHHHGSRSFIGNRIDYGAALSGNRRMFARKWNRTDVGSALGMRLIVENAREQALEHRDRAETDKAVEKLLAGIKAVPDARPLYYLLAEILIEAKQFTQALEVLGELPRNETWIQKPVLTGICRLGLDQPEEAASCADRALLFDGSWAPALNLKGLIAFKKGDRPGAEQWFRAAVDADPGFAEPTVNLGVLAWADGRREEGFDLLERGCMLNPVDGDAVASYYSAAAALGALARAEAVLREARALHPANKRLVFLLIDALLKQDKFTQAMTEIEDAMAQFGVDDGILAAALDVRAKAGPRTIDWQKQETISLCMIVKNEEARLAGCLASVYSLVDEMIVVDTGSADRTREIAEAFGGRVFDFPWNGSFADARNISLEKANGRWILVLDADEAVSSPDLARLAALVKAPEKAKQAYSLVTRNYVHETHLEGWRANDGSYPAEEQGTGWYPSAKVRLFPRDSRIRFENRVHELVEPSLRRAGISVHACPVPVHHYGKLDRDKTRIKGEEYYLLGRKKLEERPDDPDALRELAVQARELGRIDEAADLWARFARVKPGSALGHLNLGSALQDLGRYDEALAAAENAIRLAPHMKEARYNAALCELFLGNIAGAVGLLESLTGRENSYPPAEVLLAAARLCAGGGNGGASGLGLLQTEDHIVTSALEDFAARLKRAGQTRAADALMKAVAEAQNRTEKAAVPQEEH